MSAQKTIKIRDVSLRDGQQSQFATRMNHDQLLRLLPHYKGSGFYAMEVWGGAVPDATMRYLNEDPWKRLETIKAAIGDDSKLTALSRGRNLFGYNPYPDSVIKGFCFNAVHSGISIMRIFDALNDLNNMRSSIDHVKEAGGMADCAVCYTVDPHIKKRQRVRAFFAGKKLPKNVFSVDYFVKKAKAMEEAGADIISIKDMAGLIDPATGFELFSALKNEISIPINLHTHCTPGYGLASFLVGMACGVDILDTVVLAWSGGPAAPGYELIELLAGKMGISTGVNKEKIHALDHEARLIRAELAQFDQYKKIPPIFDIAATGELDPELNNLLNAAVEAAQNKDAARVLEFSQKIEAYFNYPEPDKIVQKAQIPGGMYTNMLAQLKEFKLEDRAAEVLEIVPQVRLDAGLPPLVTPTSQIVGAQAVNCLLDRSHGKPFYTNVSKNFFDLVKGAYGTTPWPIDPEFRKKITGSTEAADYDVSNFKKPVQQLLADAGDTPLIADEKEELLVELFAGVATKFLSAQKKAAWDKANPPKPERYPEQFWDYLTENIEA